MSNGFDVTDSFCSKWRIDVLDYQAMTVLIICCCTVVTGLITDTKEEFGTPSVMYLQGNNHSSVLMVLVCLVQCHSW